MSSGGNSTFNTPDEHGNVPLHNAVIRNDLKMLDHLLQQSHIDVNYKNYKGETPLVLSLRMFRTDSLALRLMESGSDLNITNKFQQTALHVALLCSSVSIAHKLIESGADINARDQDKRTPLHYAVDNDDLEAVCMLLCYGVDVSIPCKENMTAFTLALYYNRFDLAEVLFDYYEEFSDRDLDGYTALHLAVWHQNSIAVRLVQAGADVNCITFDGSNLLMFSLAYNSAELFKLIWPRFDHSLLLEHEPFLTYLISESCFPCSDWVECMYLVLESPLAFDLFHHYGSYLCNKRSEASYSGCFYELLLTFEKLNVELNDRANIIACCLSLGWEIDRIDINLAFTLYGFNEELELFIYGTDHHDEISDSDNGAALYPLPNYIFSLENDPSSEDVIDLLYNQISRSYGTEPAATRCFLNSLGFFSLPLYGKQELLAQGQWLGLDCQAVQDKLGTVPQFPSLLELSRNRVRQFIRENFKITRAYHIHDAIKNLNLPHRIQDIVRFKMALYK